MPERNYGLEISAKAAELSAELLQIMQQVPKEHIEKISQIGNEMRDIITAARKEIEPQKFYYQVYRTKFSASEEGRFINRNKAEMQIKELKNNDWPDAHYKEVLFDDYEEAN